LANEIKGLMKLPQDWISFFSHIFELSSPYWRDISAYIGYKIAEDEYPRQELESHVSFRSILAPLHCVCWAVCSVCKCIRLAIFKARSGRKGGRMGYNFWCMWVLDLCKCVLRGLMLALEQKEKGKCVCLCLFVCVVCLCVSVCGVCLCVCGVGVCVWGVCVSVCGVCVCVCACVCVVCVSVCGVCVCLCVCVCVEDLHNPVDPGLFFTPSHLNGRNSERSDYSRPRECARQSYQVCLINQFNETVFLGMYLFCFWRNPLLL